ncbi:hypothetical protein BO79DRAFT_44733 [Aspergillus costaricaensis CBS 115574]|uniref:Uncharacterized protein n=1 Tax=Aspergillus costaricaensis CBS 115574 TaxID=1448317 RepID=A0ACD1ISL5_9EURO|nr:hypothetical protein BO79DRAFT_44733 [Aspergillus costaricaensis CBS 115574]RAK93272.1 hypothetical protein BO79DRAFT_44733 [Aspergillus costaricaensis CBS 115574]
MTVMDRYDLVMFFFYFLPFFTALHHLRHFPLLVCSWKVEHNAYQKSRHLLGTPVTSTITR